MKLTHKLTYKNKQLIMSEFFRTSMGRKYYESDIPKLTKVLERIADQMELSNKIEEKKFRLDEKIKKLQIKDINEKG
jgi:hypothetical protein